MNHYEVNGIRLAVTAWQPRHPMYPPVVMLPGTGRTASDWDTIALDLSRDRVVHAVDPRGHGDSEWPRTYSIDLMATDLAELVPKLAPSVDIVGHSLGGLVACRAIATGPAKLRRAVLEDVGVPHPRIPAMPERPEGDLDFDWKMVEQVRPEIDNPAPDWPAMLARIALPMLVIGGGPLSFVPQEYVDELAATVRQGHRLTIDAGHNIHSAKPREFLDAVRAFLDS